MVTSTCEEPLITVSVFSTSTICDEPDTIPLGNAPISKKFTCWDDVNTLSPLISKYLKSKDEVSWDEPETTLPIKSAVILPFVMVKFTVDESVDCETIFESLFDISPNSTWDEPLNTLSPLISKYLKSKDEVTWDEPLTIPPITSPVIFPFVIEKSIVL